MKNVLLTGNGSKSYSFLVDYSNHTEVTGNKLIPLRITHMESSAQAIEVREPTPGTCTIKTLYNATFILTSILCRINEFVDIL